MRSESDLSDRPSDGDRGSSSSGLSEGSAPRNTPRPRSKRVVLLVLGALIVGVAGWQLLSPLNTDSHGESQLNAGSHGESSSAVGTQAFAAHGVSFTYPAALHHLDGDEAERLPGEIPIFKTLSLEEPAWK